jgi:lysyl-tRNA synthetase class 1
MDIRKSHWSEQLAERVIKERKEPYIITAGITTSGPSHLGTLCEFLFPATIKKAIEKKGHAAKFYFIADILDAFDSVPLAMKEYEKDLVEHLGKPLCNVPDPTGKSASFGDHFLDEVKELMKKFTIEAEIIRINEAYRDGRFDSYARFFLKNETQAKEIIERTSGKKEKKDWSPIMPICKRCGKIATTVVTSHDEENYSYKCERDVKYTKGCGYEGKGKISDHEYKLVWRLHWPSWMDVFGTSIEGAGVDHHTRGGSWDTLVAVFREMFKKEPPLGYRYGFVLFKGRKYSKSLGIGMGVAEMLKLLPPEIIKYVLLKPDLQENIDIEPTPENLLRTFEEFQETAKLAEKKPEELNRSEEKRLTAFYLSTEKIKWKVSFLDAIIYYQIYNDWEKVAEMVNDREGIGYLKQYVEEWLARNFLPDEYSFKYKPQQAEENVKRFVEKLDEKMDALAIHNFVFEFAKENNIEPKELFKLIYKALIGKERGPRIGKLIAAIGIKRIKNDIIRAEQNI